MPSLGSAARVCVQSAAELRYVQCHGDERHVLRVLRACPPAFSQALPLRAACAAAAPHALPPPRARTSPCCIACPSLGSAGRVGVQPAAELRHVQRDEHALHIPRALASRAMAPQRLVWPSPSTRRLRRRSPTPSRLPDRTSPLITHALLSPRQGAHSLSDTNKLAIRCAWADSSALASAGYDSRWVSGSCS